MAELKQKEFGVSTQFQTLTPHKAPDFRAENIKSGIALAGAIGKSEASASGRKAARSLTGTDLSLEEVNRNVDIFEETMANNVTDAQVESGGTVSSRQINEIKDATLSQVNLSSRGLQEAINRGVISHLEATARANITLQRASNSLIGSLFQDEFRNAFSKVTGNPAGSPALALNKSPAEIQEEANKKAVVEANAARTKQVQTVAARDGSTFDQAEFKLVALEVEAAKVTRMNALDKENLRSDEQKLKESGIEFSVASAPLMDNITAAVVSGGGIDPNEVSSLTQNIKAISDNIINSHITKGMGSKAQKALRESSAIWTKVQLDYINDISQGKISKETQELVASAAKNQMAADTPIIHAMSVTGNTDLAQILAKAGPEARKTLTKRWGFDVEKLTNITDPLLSLYKVMDTKQERSPPDSGKLPGVMAGASGEQNKQIIDQYKNSGGSLADLASEWKAAPAMSLQTIANSLGDQIEKGDKNSVEVGIAMLNESVEKYHRLIADYPNTAGEYSVSFKRRDVRTTKPFGIQKGAAKPVISFPNGVPEGEQEIIKQLYRALEKTPSLWQDDFIDAKDVFENMMNQGFRFDAAQISGGAKAAAPIKEGKLEPEFDPAGELVSSILDFTELDDEQALSDKFDRIVEQARKIRERGTATDGGKPLKPAAEQIGEAVRDAPKSFLSAASTARVGEAGEPEQTVSIGTKQAQPEFERLEGRRSASYDDSLGNRTVGIGFNMEDKGAKAVWNSLNLSESFADVKSGKEDLSSESIDKLFEVTYANAVRDADKVSPLEGIPADARNVLIDVVFNMGMTKVKKGFPSFVKNFKDGNYADAADELEFTDPNANVPKQTDYIKQVKGRGRANLKKLRSLGNGGK